MNYGQVRCRVGEMRRDHNTEGVVTKEVGKIGDTTTSLGDHRIWGVCTHQILHVKILNTLQVLCNKVQ